MKINKRASIFFVLLIITLLFQMYVAFSPTIAFRVYQKLGIVALGLFWLSMAVKYILKNKSTIKQKRNVMTLFIWTVFIIYIINLVYLLFFDGDFGRNITLQNNKLLANMVQGINLEPFKMIKDYILAYQNNNIYLAQLLLNIFGNLIVFAPMGLLLPTLFETMDSFFRFPLFMATLIIMSEFAQVYFSVGVGDIDDFILNFTGALILFLIYKIPYINRMWKKLLYRN